MVTITQINPTPTMVQSARSGLRRIWVPYTVEILANLGYGLLSVGIFFYTRHQFGWTLMQNFLLAAALGLVYIAGSLLSRRIAARIGIRRGLMGIYAAMGLLALAGLAPLPVYAITAVLIVYTFVTSLHSPLLQGMVSRGADAPTLSRRLSLYNLTWSGVGALTLACNGTLIEHWPAGVFVVPLAAHALSVALLAFWGEDPPRESPTLQQEAACPPELLQNRTLALWLARISMPATYVVVYSLLAMMPSLPILQNQSPSAQTLLGSVWLMARWLSFLALGLTSWWHTRPQILLTAALVMLIGFMAIVFQPDSSSLNLPAWLQLAWLLGWQAALGVTLGMIYSGSLYFGMVLSKGSVTHGGYHEALVGLGAVLGPGSGALALHLAPTRPALCMAVIAGLIGAVVLAGSVMACRRRTL